MFEGEYAGDLEENPQTVDAPSRPSHIAPQNLPGPDPASANGQHSFGQRVTVTCRKQISASID